MRRAGWPTRNNPGSPVKVGAPSSLRLIRAQGTGEDGDICPTSAKNLAKRLQRLTYVAKVSRCSIRESCGTEQWSGSSQVGDYLTVYPLPSKHAA